MEAKILSRQIEGAQKKVEEQNFVMRKNVLKYDDVLNRHRGRIYEQRRAGARGRGHVGAGEAVDRRGGRGHRPAVHRGAVRGGVGPRGADERDGRALPDGDHRGGAARGPRARSRARRSSRSSSPTRATSTTRRRRSSGRSSCASSSASWSCRSSTSAGASTSTTWTTSARASASARWRRRTRSSSTPPRASACSPCSAARSAARSCSTSSTPSSRPSSPSSSSSRSSRRATATSAYEHETAAGAEAIAAAGGSDARPCVAAVRRADRPAEARAERPVLVRVGQEVQEVPRRLRRSKVLRTFDR